MEAELTMPGKVAATARHTAVRRGERSTAAKGMELAEPEDESHASQPTARLAAARALIERDFRRRRLCLADVARAAHFSEYHFHRLFRRHYGATPKQLISALRIAEVQRLALTGSSLSDASASTGFSHQSHMTARFKQAVGMTPRQWLVKARRGEVSCDLAPV